MDRVISLISRLLSIAIMIGIALLPPVGDPYAKVIGVLAGTIVLILYEKA